MLRSALLRLLALGALIVGGLTACTKAEPAPESQVDKNLSRLTSDLDDGVLTHTIAPKGEQVSVVTTYSTVYDVKSWHITTNKTLNLSLKVKDAPEGTTVMAEHVHADASLVSGTAAFAGITQDSMDNAVHGGDQPGFLVTQKYAYQEIFAIEGYSETLISGWSYQVGDYGSGEISEKRLTEKNLREQGKVTGNKLTFIYDLLIKYPNDTAFHKVAIQDEFIVPVG